MTEAEQPRRQITQAERDMVFDYLKYAPANLKIQTEQGQLAPFSFNEIQLLLHEIAQDLEALTGMVRMVILKARREGVTTYWTGQFFHDTIHNRNRYSYIITHEPDATDFVFKMVKRYYDNCAWKPATKYNNTTLLEFNNTSGTGLDSAFRVATANKKDIGSAQLIHNLLLSEIAKYSDGSVDEVLNSILQCVPDEPNTRVIMESTAKGAGGEFPKRFWSARYVYALYLERGKARWKRSINPDADANSVYAQVFIPCHVFSKHQMDPEPGFKRTTIDHPIYGNEQILAITHGVGDCFLAWRRWTIVNKCRGSLDVFHQEFPMTARESFLFSGRPVFDPIDTVDKRMRECKPALAHYSLQNNQWIATQPIDGNTDGLLQVWEEPGAGQSYVVSADISEGLESGDFDSVDVLHQQSGRQVAHWHGHTAPDVLGKLLNYVGVRYNWAWIAPERNNHGLTTITQLVNMSYPNIIPQLNTHPGEPPKRHYGFFTGTSKTGGKAVVIDELSAFFRANPEAIRCEQTCAEMVTFKHNADGTMGAERGHYDDRVVSFGIGNYVRTRLPAPKAPYETERTSSADRNLGEPTAAAWT